MTAQLRVISVGRTGLESTLRRDARVELVRAQTAVEAIGELSDPVFDDSPTSTVVVVAPGAEPPSDLIARFVDAMRTVDQDVTVLRSTDEGDTPTAYDGVAEPNASTESLAGAIRAARNTRLEHARSVSEQPARPEPAPINPDDTIGDESVASALLEGADVVTAAEQLINLRTGADDVRFMPGDGGQSPAPGVDVLWHGQVAGTLHSAMVDPDTLGRHAEWLSHWLRLTDQQADLRQAAFTDSLTGAWNRRYFDRFLRVALEQTRRTRGALTVMVFDIDNFKHFNDEYGHSAGDSILAETVQLLRSVIRPSDRVCRIGGDEFAVIFHEPEGPRDTSSKHPTSIFGIAKRFQQQICNHRFPKLAEQAPGTLTISAGLATYPWDGSDAETLIERADQLALQSKKQGKNAITLGPGAITQCSAEDFDVS